MFDGEWVGLVLNCLPLNTFPIRNMKRTILLCLSVVIFIINASAQNQYSIYLKPDSNSEIIEKVNSKDGISVVDQTNYFYKVSYKNKTGYILKSQWDVTQKSSTSKTVQSSKSTGYKPKTSQKYIRGPRGGCYYINSNGKKVYVDRSLCN